MKELCRQAGYKTEWGVAYAAIIGENISDNVANKNSKLEASQASVKTAIEKK